MGAVPAVRLLWGDGERFEVDAHDLDLDLDDNIGVFDRLDGFGIVDVSITSFAAGPFDLDTFELTRDGERPVLARLHRRGPGLRPRRLRRSSLGLPGGPLASIALDLFGGDDVAVPIALDLELDSDDGRIQVTGGDADGRRRAGRAARRADHVRDRGPTLSVERTASGLAFERTGAGPPVLLIHEGIADRTMWDPQWRAWSDRFTLIRYDLRGYGDSPDAEAPTRSAATRSRCSTPPAASARPLIGASIGGKAALDLALLAPERSPPSSRSSRPRRAGSHSPRWSRRSSASTRRSRPRGSRPRTRSSCRCGSTARAASPAAPTRASAKRSPG